MSLSVAACSTLTSEPVAVTPAVDPFQTMLHAAAVDVSAALRMLAETNNAAAQPHLSKAQKRQAIIAATRTPAGMDEPVTVAWAGPVEIEQVLNALSAATGYHLQVIGHPPTPPIIVHIYSKAGNPAINVLRDAAFQAGDRATIDVFEDGRKIVLRYHS